MSKTPKEILREKLENFGGQGDTPVGELTRSDMKLIERAIRREWNIPDVVMSALPTKVAKIFQEERNARNQLSAAKVLMNMVADNRETARLNMEYHGAGNDGVYVNIANAINLDVNQKMTKADVSEAINELTRLGIASDGNPESEVRTAPADGETAHISGGSN